MAYEEAGTMLNQSQLIIKHQQVVLNVGRDPLVVFLLGFSHYMTQFISLLGVLLVHLMSGSFAAQDNGFELVKMICCLCVLLIIIIRRNSAKVE